MMQCYQPHIPFVTTGSYPVRAGNLLRPLIDGIPAFRRIGDAVEQARHSVWLTVTFYAHDFALPEGRGSLFDLLDRAVDRSLDVRLIFWRPDAETAGYGRTFAGSNADREFLRARGSRFRIRWDQARGPYCHHQKIWLIDAGTPQETAFVGGINLTAQALGSPGHRDGRRHDAYLEIMGPSVTDVHHNFVQRWNETSDRTAEDGTWAHDGDDDMPFPRTVSPSRGSSMAQIQRTIDADRYRDGTATPGGQPYAISAGERSILEQYCRAIDSARATIYIENQAIPIPEVAERLERALQRGVAVVMLVPADPEQHVRIARRNPAQQALFEALAALRHHDNFAMAGIASLDDVGKRRNIYVHGKLMLVDDAWATIGSCNLHAFSLQNHSELNASFWDPVVVRSLRCALFAEHLETDCSAIDDGEAIALYRQISRENRRKRDAGDPRWQGLAFALDPAAYGE